MARNFLSLPFLVNFSYKEKQETPKKKKKKQEKIISRLNNFVLDHEGPLEIILEDQIEAKVHFGCVKKREKFSIILTQSNQNHPPKKRPSSTKKKIAGRKKWGEGREMFENPSKNVHHHKKNNKKNF